MESTLRIVLWNANGLSNHKLELQNFLQMHKIDIALISETHFTNKTVFKIPHYKVYHIPHPDNTAHGGAAVIIRNAVAHHELIHHQSDKIQAASIQVNTNQRPFTVSAIYCPPRHTIAVEEYIAFFESQGSRFVIGGDWNAKHTVWGSRLITPKGRNLLCAITRQNCEHLSTGEPTYWPTDPNKIPDLLDFFVLHGITSSYTQIESSFELSSDHSPVIATFSTHVIRTPIRPTLTTKQTNWDSFRTYIEEHINLNLRIKDQNELDEATQYFTTLIQEAAWYSTPNSEDESSIVENIPLRIRELVTEKRRARSRWQRSRNQEDRHIYNRLRRKLHKALTNARNTTFEHYITSLSKDDHTIWKATKKFKRPQISIPPIRKDDGSWAKSDPEKAATFAKHLEQVFTPLPNLSPTDNEIENFLEIPCQLSLPIKSFSPREVIQEIKNIGMHKAPGYDLITGTILRQLPRKAIVLLTIIYNSMLRLLYYPLMWKFAQIIMIPKPGKPVNEVNSFRPISLLPIPSKLFEKLLMKRIRNDLDLSTIIPEYQFGFRKRHSTIQQTHRIVNKIASSLEEKTLCTAVFLDVAQAFDKVWHTGLLYKIKNTLPSPYYLLLKSYISERHFQIKYNNSYSACYQVKSGVPQGSVLGPLLYLIFTADLPTTNNTTIATFADDTALVAVNNDPVVASQRLQHHLNLLQHWFSKWKIKINQTKSVQVTFTTKHKTCPPVTINNIQIPVQSEVKYLGLHLDQKLTWQKHVKTKRQQLNIKLREMSWLMGRKSKLSIENKLLLYKCILKPIWTYGIQLWGCTKPSNTKIIQRLQSKVLRLVTNAPWYVSNVTLHNDLQISFVKDEIHRFSTLYYKNILSHENSLIDAELINQPNVTRRLRRQWPCDLQQPEEEETITIPV